MKALRYKLAMLCGIMAACTVSGMAHPHIFIDVSPVFVFDDGGFKGIRVTWVFDEFFSEQILLDCDTDGDGALSDEELEIVKKDYFSYLKDYDYFSAIEINDEETVPVTVRDFSACVLDDHNTVQYDFFIPLDASSSNRISYIKYTANDPTIYVSFSTTKKEIQLEGKGVSTEYGIVEGYSYYGYIYEFKPLFPEEKGNE